MSRIKVINLWCGVSEPTRNRGYFIFLEPHHALDRVQDQCYVAQVQIVLRFQSAVAHPYRGLLSAKAAIGAARELHHVVVEGVELQTQSPPFTTGKHYK